MEFRNEQLEKLSNLCMDLAKGLFLTALAIPAFSPNATMMISIKSTAAGIIFTYFSLKIIELKEAKT